MFPIVLYMIRNNEKFVRTELFVAVMSGDVDWSVVSDADWWQIKDVVEFIVDMSRGSIERVQILACHWGSTIVHIQGIGRVIRKWTLHWMPLLWQID